MSRAYDDHEPLISLHIPKCAGQSLAASLFGCRQSGYRVIPFYPDIGMGLPEGWNADRTIIHGHFVRWKGHAVEDICPGQHQFTSVIREPFDALVSGYAYGLQSGYDWAVNQSLDAFLDWWLQSGNSPLLGSLPAVGGARTMEEYAGRFVLLGVIDHLDSYVEALGDLLRVDIPPPERSNTSSTVSLGIPDRRAEFRRAMPLDFELFDYVSSLHRSRGPSIRSLEARLAIARKASEDNRAWADRVEKALESERGRVTVLESRLEAAQALSRENRAWAERVEQALEAERKRTCDLQSRLAAAQALSGENRAWAERTEKWLESERAAAGRLARRLEEARNLSDEMGRRLAQAELALDEARAGQAQVQSLLEEQRKQTESLERELSPLRAFASRFRWLYSLFLRIS